MGYSKKHFTHIVKLIEQTSPEALLLKTRDLFTNYRGTTDMTQ